LDVGADPADIDADVAVAVAVLDEVLEWALVPIATKGEGLNVK